MRKLIPLSDSLEPFPEDSEHPCTEDDQLLKNHIRENGQLTAIVMVGDRVLNGRRRIKLLRELKAEGAIDPSTGKVFEFVIADIKDAPDNREHTRYI